MVYIDLLIIEDFIYNYVILYGVSLLLTRITSFKKIFIASLIGIIPLIFLIVDVDSKITLMITFIFSIIMSIITFSYKDLLHTIKNVIYMYLIGIFLAGFVNLININLFPDINSYVLNVILLIILAPITTIIYIKSIKKIKINNSYYYKLDIYLTETEKITVTSFLDTGNKLIDPYKQRPIILLTKIISLSFSYPP